MYNIMSLTTLTTCYVNCTYHIAALNMASEYNLTDINIQMFQHTYYEQVREEGELYHHFFVTMKPFSCSKHNRKQSNYTFRAP